MKRAVLSGLLALAAVRPAHAQVANTDIFLAPITRQNGGLSVGSPVNVTHRPGYDNQPSFTPDNKAILYTAIGTDGQADIWRYDLAARRTTRVTSTPESEYSATVMPDGDRFSAIRVERDSTQRLWSFALDGSDPRPVLMAVRPVGYHLWLDLTRLVVYVLGTPNSMHIINRDGSNDVVRATDIGRAMQRLPNGPGFTYTQRDTGNLVWIMGQDIDRPRAYHLVHAPPGNEFHAFLPDGTMLSATGAVLVQWDGVTGSAGSWTRVADFSRDKIRNITRIAISRDGQWVAFVAEAVP